MSWHLTGIVARKKLGSQSRKLLMLSMADKANDDGTGIFASFQTLATMCEGSRPTVKRLIKEFLDEGLIHHDGMRPCQNGETNEYSIMVGALKARPDLFDDLNPVRHDPGSKAKRPGSPLTPTGVTVTPKPILQPTSSSNDDEPAPIKVHAMRRDWRPSEAARAYGRQTLRLEDWEIDIIAHDVREYWLENPKTRRAGWDGTFKRRMRDVTVNARERAKLKIAKPANCAPRTPTYEDRLGRLKRFAYNEHWQPDWGPKPTEADLEVLGGRIA